MPENEEGTLWHVFDYNAGTGTITPRNVMTYSNNPGNVGTYSLENEELNGDPKTDISAIKESIVEKQNTK